MSTVNVFILQLNSDRGITDLNMDSLVSFAGTLRNRLKDYLLVMLKQCSALWIMRWPGLCGTFRSASLTGSSCVKKNFISTLASTIWAKTSHSLSISFCTHTSRCLMSGAVKSLGFRAALLLTKWVCSSLNMLENDNKLKKFADQGWSDLPRRQGCGYCQWIHWSYLPKHTPRTHHHQCCFQQENEDPKI